MMLIKQREAEKTAEELKDIMIELDQKEFNKKMLENQLQTEKVKTNSKKVKS
jgi:hypothetical protein